MESVDSGLIVHEDSQENIVDGVRDIKLHNDTVVESREVHQQQTKSRKENNNTEGVLDQLENVELTEEDTEMLLEEAYAVNRQLKEILREQERNGRRSSSKHSVLPPIKNDRESKQTGVSKMRTSTSRLLSGTQKEQSKISGRSHSPTRSKSVTSPSRSSVHKSSSRQSRPPWNDRFSHD